MIWLMRIAVCWILMVHAGASFSYLAPPSDYEAFSLEQPQQLSLTDWDSALYGRPVCQPIPSNMSLCRNMNYKLMKVPNLLGHETTEEILYQSTAWQQLVSANCHKDTQLFLCSLFAPVCVEQQQASIYPCKSLCESVKNSCEGPMLAYNYPWPQMFNCTRFPDNNGLCVQSLEQTAPTTMPTTTTTVRTSTARQEERNSTKNRPRLKNNQICSGCDNELRNLEHIVSTYCTSNIVFRGRISSVKGSSLDQFNGYQPKRLNRNNTRPILSSYAVVSRRDRRIFKGFKYLSNFAVNSYLRDRDSSSHSEDGIASKKLNIFLLSKHHLNICKANTRKAKRLRESGGQIRQSPNESPFTRFSRAKSSSRTRRDQLHCKCNLLNKNMHRQRFLIMANLLRTRSLAMPKAAKRTRNLKNARNMYDIIDHESSQPRREEAQQLKKLIYVTGVVKWHRARPFIDYLEDDSIDKSDMCLDIKQTVRDIRKDAKERF